jgi:hypothetical protein
MTFIPDRARKSGSSTVGSTLRLEQESGHELPSTVGQSGSRRRLRLFQMKMDQREDEEDKVGLNQEPPRVRLNLASLSILAHDGVVDAYDQQPQAFQHGRNKQIDQQFGNEFMSWGHRPSPQ